MNEQPDPTKPPKIPKGPPGKPPKPAARTKAEADAYRRALVDAMPPLTAHQQYVVRSNMRPAPRAA